MSQGAVVEATEGQVVDAPAFLCQETTVVPPAAGRLAGLLELTTKRLEVQELWARRSAVPKPPSNATVTARPEKVRLKLDTNVVDDITEYATYVKHVKQDAGCQGNCLKMTGGGAALTPTAFSKPEMSKTSCKGNTDVSDSVRSLFCICIH